MPATPEQQARQKIDAQLIAAGWMLQDCKQLNLGATRDIAGMRACQIEAIANLEKSFAAGTTFSPDQLAWLNLMRDHIATSVTVEPDDFACAPFSQRGGPGRAHQLFGAQLPALLDELNTALAA
ncbi:MAG: hypothetical protein LBM04_02010 [Opitutaceae bacterium]|jgi:hypothetical protein|nr:hypothetical protein [Opitutaceae bacterium]